MGKNTTNIPSYTKEWNHKLSNANGKQGCYTTRTTTSNHDSNARSSISRPSKDQRNDKENQRKILVAWNDKMDPTICRTMYNLPTKQQSHKYTDSRRRFLRIPRRKDHSNAKQIPRNLER